MSESGADRVRVIEVIEPGPLASVQDLGRPGYAALGVARSGAFDRAALRLANRLVGNAEDCAAIEVTYGGLHLRIVDAATIALTGAVCAGPTEWGTPVSMAAGATLCLGVPAHGLRSYLAVRGGIAVDAVLGSRSTDSLSGIGPPALRAGMRLPVGRADRELVVAIATPPARARTMPVRLGPRDDWFTEAAVRTLVHTDWTVRSDSDRVGIRLDGPALERAAHRELPSEAVLPGAIQVPSDGRPIVFGPDAPVTGGYPVIGVVGDLDPAAQLRPGDSVRFRLV